MMVIWRKQDLKNSKIGTNQVSNSFRSQTFRLELLFLFLIYFHSWIVVIHDDQSLIIMIQFVTILAILIKQV
jgi:hypothetical protein